MRDGRIVTAIVDRLERQMDPNYTACAFALGRGLYCTQDVRRPHVHVKPPYYVCTGCVHTTDDYNDAHFDYPDHNRKANAPSTEGA